MRFKLKARFLRDLGKAKSSREANPEDEDVNFNTFKSNNKSQDRTSFRTIIGTIFKSQKGTDALSSEQYREQVINETQNTVLQTISSPFKIDTANTDRPIKNTKANNFPEKRAEVKKHEKQLSCLSIDIDKNDVDDLVAASKYVNQIYSFLKEKEMEAFVGVKSLKKPPLSPHMRSILMNWVFEMHQRLNLLPDTLFLSVHIINQYLENKTDESTDFQLIGLGSILIAVKYEELSPPSISSLLFEVENSFTKSQLVEMEFKIFSALNFKIYVPTSYCFLLRYLKAARADRKLVHLCCYICERMLIEPEMVDYLPSQIAAASIYIGRKNFNEEAWSTTLLKYTEYIEDDILPCAREICLLMKRPTLLTSVYKKFNQTKFSSIADAQLQWEV